MARRLFIDLETTGDGSSKYHDIIEINAVLTNKGNTVSEFNAAYGFDSKTVFSGGRNYHKAKKHKEEGKEVSSIGINSFIDWLDVHIPEGKKTFLVSYNCS